MAARPAGSERPAVGSDAHRLKPGVSMLGYDLRLALSSLRRTPALTALMIGAIGLGISACIVTLTVHHAMSGNPIWWKNKVLYAVTMDSRDLQQSGTASGANGEPDQLSYRDATYLYGSSIPRRKAIMASVSGWLSGVPGQSGPALIRARATSGDFFRMFDVPFEYGGAWDTAADRGPEPVIVLSREENEKLFGGADSVGRSILFNNNLFRIVGVLERWNPQPRYYDMTVDAFGDPDEVFIPFGWDEQLGMIPNGHTSCWGSENPQTFEQLTGSGCVWLLLWVELPSAASRQRYQAFVDSYWAAQRRMGRFPRPRDNRLWRVSQWLTHHHVVTDQSRLLLRLAFAFLAVCLINTIGIELTKFLRSAPFVGIRRALGASRRHVFQQHFVETALIALAGSALGLALGWAELGAVHALYTGSNDAYGRLARFDPLGALWALGLAALATIVAGLYPAWRIGRVPPAVYLKSQ
jgi:putative ABC transport system permease protein